MAESPSFEPRALLVDQQTWKAESPDWRTDAPPSWVAAAKLQHRLAWLLRRHIKETLRLSREDASRHLGMSRGHLWRLLDGQAPVSLVQSAAWARELRLELALVEHGPNGSSIAGSQT